MRTIEITLYKFDELSEDAKQKAIENLQSINVDFDWRNATYEDAEQVGLKITSFDLDRNRHATGEFIEGSQECANKIIENHGKTCDTFKTAQDFLTEWSELVDKYSDGKNKDVVTEENEQEFDQEADELEQEFLKSILEDYSIMLQNESEYLMSEEAIIETIHANEYEFTEDGELA